MSASVNIRHVKGITFLEVSGRITLGEGGFTLRNAIQDALDAGTKKLVLDLSNVNYVDSSGLGEFTTAYTSTRENGCELKLVGLTKKIDQLMQITKLATLFDVFSTEQQALLSFEG
ncbi:MAG: STAS domain-containing protein [Acidobacteriaceae bacterium]